MEKLPAPDLPPWIAKEVPFTRYRVAVGDGLNMHVMETGRGRPVLMVHGNPTWGFLYRHVASTLADEPLRLIMPDLIGLIEPSAELQGERGPQDERGQDPEGLGAQDRAPARAGRAGGTHFLCFR